MDFEAMAAECRSASFRETLGASAAWVQAKETVEECVAQLKLEIHVEGLGQAGGAAGQENEEDDGMSYTFHVDRNNPTAEELRSDFSSSTLVVRDTESVERQLSASTSVFRFLRNACAASPINQDACREHELIKLAHSVVLNCCHWVDLEEDELKAMVVLLAQVALQFCVNCVTGNEKNQAAVWGLFYPEHFQKILVECHQHRKVVAFVVALLLNCVNSQSVGANSEAIEGVASRRVDLVCARNLVITILHRCMVKPSSSNTSEGEVQTEYQTHMDEQDPAFEWICMLFSSLFRDGHAKDLYNAVGAHMLSKLWSRVTPEQLILLRMFTMWAVSTPNPSARAIAMASAADVKEAAAQKPAIPPETFEFVKNTWTYVITVSDEDRPEEADELRRRMWVELENEAKLMLLDVMGELTVGRVKLDEVAARELLLSLLQELQRVWELGRNDPKTTNAAAANSMLALRGEPLGYRSGIIRVVGNLSFRHTEHQELVREEGYLPLFLNHCNIDETNPLIREWSLVALRNLCEGNEANQSYINELRPQGMDSASSATLEKAQMHAEIGDDGKVQLKKDQ